MADGTQHILLCLQDLIARFLALNSGLEPCQVWDFLQHTLVANQYKSLKDSLTCSRIQIADHLLLLMKVQKRGRHLSFKVVPVQAHLVPFFSNLSDVPRRSVKSPAA